MAYELGRLRLALATGIGVWLVHAALADRESYLLAALCAAITTALVCRGGPWARFGLAAALAVAMVPRLGLAWLLWLLQRANAGV